MFCVYVVWVGACLLDFHLNLALFIPFKIYWLNLGLMVTEHFII